MKRMHIGATLIGAALLFLLDRITKVWALRACADAWHINQFLTCTLAFNRGVSWSFFSFADDARFIVLSMLIACITIGLMIHAWHTYRAGLPIYGELLVITGSVSNLIDRVLYGGVVDFIMLSYGSFSWPVFNIADTCIVCGVFLMILQMYRTS